MPIRRSLAPLFLCALLACSSTEPPSAPLHSASEPSFLGATWHEDEPSARTRIERAAAGLLYTSESDYPFTWFQFVASTVGPLDTISVRQLVGALPGTAVQVVSLDDFFARHIERVDPADRVAVALVPRYRRLRETLRHAARDVRVYRVGTVRVDCYLIGVDRDGTVIGLSTVAIET